MDINFNVITDTATIVVFDLQSLKHRITDTPDWWSITEDEMDEINNGNALFLNLGDDGEYLINVVEVLSDYDGVLYMHSPSGDVFIGAGEDTTGGDLEPDDTSSISGRIIKLPPASYSVKYKRSGNEVFLSFSRAEESKNSIEEPIRL